MNKTFGKTNIWNEFTFAVCIETYIEVTQQKKNVLGLNCLIPLAARLKNALLRDNSGESFFKNTQPQQRKVLIADTVFKTPTFWSA